MFMATKTTFSPEEWQLLMESVVSSGVAVSAAEPSGLWGTLKEGFASARAIAEVKNNPQADELIKAIASDIETSDGRKRLQDGLRKKLQGKPEEIKSRSIEMLQQASRLLDAKAPQDALAVKTWMREIGQRVAEAAPEGGWMGFGGVKVSAAEQATVSEIARALNLPA
jgi:hypothetical protein